MKITEQEIKKITKMYLDGISVKDISQRTHACMDTIRKYLQANCIEFVERKNLTFANIIKEGDKERIDRLNEEYQNTQNDFFLRKYRVTSSTVLKEF